MTIVSPCVYAIICPITNKVMYVGQTHAPATRFKAHMYSNNTSVGFWVQELLSYGHEPIFKKLKTFRYKICAGSSKASIEISGLLLIVESEFILKYSKKGQAIFNKKGNPYYKSDVVTEYLSNLPFNTPFKHLA